jgi:hypothetical protein
MCPKLIKIKMERKEKKKHVHHYTSKINQENPENKD